MKFIKSLFLLSLSFSSYAQEVEHQEKTFLVKENSIFLDTMDVTDHLDKVQKNVIFDKAKKITKDSIEEKVTKKVVNKAAKEAPNNIEEIANLNEKKYRIKEEYTKEVFASKEQTTKEKQKREKEIQKRLKEKEKEAKKTEKQLKENAKQIKKQEAEIKKKEKAKRSFNKTKDKYISATKKYKKLKGKGKLSPVDEEKWIKKIADLKVKTDKTQSKLNKL